MSERVRSTQEEKRPSIDMEVDKLKNIVHVHLTKDCEGYQYTEENKSVLASISSQIVENKKGVLLRGNVGSGKTTIMKAFWNALSSAEIGFGMKTSLTVSGEFATKGHNGISKYISKPKDRFTGIFCFDDLGMEGNSKFYGNDLNVMASIIAYRYELFKQGIVTHFTTNLTNKEIEFNYGDAALSRLHEMCEFYTLGDGDSIDWRKNA